MAAVSMQKEDVKNLLALLKRSRLKPEDITHFPFTMQQEKYEEEKREFISYFENVLRSR